MLWTSGPRRIITILPLLIITLSLLFLTRVQAQQTHSAVIRVTTFDESDKPVSGVVVDVKLKGSLVGTMTTNEKGEAEFAKLAPGAYEVVVSRETFEPLTQSDVALTAGAPVEIKFTMIPKVQLKDVVVNVQAGQDTPVEKGASPAVALSRVEVKNVPSRPATV